MRRTVALAVGACTVVALAGVAGATAYARTGEEPAPAAVSARTVDRAEVGPAGAAGAPGKAAPPRKAADTPRTEERADRSRRLVGREQIGSVEQVDKVIGYLDGQRKMTLRYPGAAYVKPHFSRVLLLPGDYLTISDPSGAEVHRVESGLLPGPGRWGMSISGDTAVVELHSLRPDLLGLESTIANLGVGVDKVAHGFSADERARQPRNTPESVCGGDQKADAVCYKSKDPVAYERSKAVARLLINGNELCTAWRVGPNNRMMTNNHCIVTSADAYETEVWFNYQCAECEGHAVFRSTKVWGDKVLSTDEELDYTLFTVEDFDQVEKFGYLEFDVRRPAKGEELYIPQHPGGDPTEIAMTSDEDANGNCAVDDPSYTGYAAASDISYYCDTEGGSSGSPVISKRTDKVLALHHFGGCPNSGVRIDLIYNKIKSRL
ncbi:serine protease [Phytohabitans sp. ZYX-F-186]|uniref:Serine protease n=1 Tax=Phytohabitans maris TaxID=3071409 RepID=A0ABU0ZHW7_9ACTN|nr:serine protease [Phytohabitans sp. ZYX-F-186]MDQ7906628.1 serine protease [Phytohabitans sp. ZYX-F-186]